uniref:Uncharacterized protein n=1 Tax=Populus trichocarpa TaxID=3694 RepID=A0A3N7G350_POPTR
MSFEATIKPGEGDTARVANISSFASLSSRWTKGQMYDKGLKAHPRCLHG